MKEHEYEEISERILYSHTHTLSLILVLLYSHRTGVRVELV